MTDDSPWQDLKDARDGANKTMKGIDDFATHSNSRVIGPLATSALRKCKELFHRWFANPEEQPKPEEKTDV